MQAQALISQLIFDHSLRIRVKAETTGGSTPATPDTASDVEHGNAHQAPSARRGADSVSGAKKVGVTSLRSNYSTHATASDSNRRTGNLAGKLFNLITSDLTNLVDGREFLYVGMCFGEGMLLTAIVIAL